MFFLLYFHFLHFISQYSLLTLFYFSLGFFHFSLQISLTFCFFSFSILLFLLLFYFSCLFFFFISFFLFFFIFWTLFLFYSFVLLFLCRDCPLFYCLERDFIVIYPWDVITL